MEAAIRSALKTGCSMLVLDLSRASEVSPSGVDGIVQSLAEIRERGGDLVLLNPAAAVKEVLKTLEALGLIRHITTVQSVEEAMDFFSVKLPSFASSRQT
jgi:anti-anti-sigma factor